MLTVQEKDALAQGLARIHRGRVVPIVRGGATYTPKELIKAKALGNGSGAITTWQYQNTGTLGAVARSMIFSGQGGATGTVSVQIGVTGATSIATQTIVDAEPVTANLPLIMNGWYVVDVNDFLSGFAANTTTNGAAYGVLAT